jgi:phosphatidylglycerol:prolipoprotein diacylglycerol transferase
MQPVLFKLGWIAVPSFTALMALGLGAGLALTWREARRMGLAPIDALDVALVAVLVGLLAARAGYVIEHWDYYRNHVDEIARVWQGGLSWYTGLAGGVCGAAAASAWRRLDARAVFDALAPGLMASAALGWIGCHLAGVAYGREVFPGERWWFLAADLPDIYRLWNPRIATQLLGAGWAALVSVAVWAARTRAMLRPGVRFAAAMTLYSAGMLALGFARGDLVPMVVTWRADQVADALIVAASVAYILWAGRGPRPAQDRQVAARNHS